MTEQSWSIQTRTINGNRAFVVVQKHPHKVVGQHHDERKAQQQVIDLLSATQDEWQARTDGKISIEFDGDEKTTTISSATRDDWQARTDLQPWPTPSPRTSSIAPTPLEMARRSRMTLSNHKSAVAIRDLQQKILRLEYRLRTEQEDHAATNGRERQVRANLDQANRLCAQATERLARQTAAYLNEINALKTFQQAGLTIVQRKEMEDQIVRLTHQRDVAQASVKGLHAVIKGLHAGVMKKLDIGQ